MMTSRANVFLANVFLGFIAAVVSAIGLVSPAMAQGKPLQKVRIVAATGVLDVTYRP